MGVAFVKLTTRGRYAVTAMLDLALHAEAGPVSLADVADRQSISLAYLEQLFACLRRAELVQSIRGPGGGYRLTKESEAVSVADIIDSVDEGVDATRCGGSGDCHDGDMCLTHELWTDLSEQIHEFLGGISLAQMAARQGVRLVADRQQQAVTHRIPAQAL